MDDIITVTGIWLISLLAGLLSIRQSRGTDWYQPITNRHKMIMTLINISAFSAMLMLYYNHIFSDWTILVLVGGIILFMLIANFIRNKIFGSRPKTDDNKGRRLKDLFQRFLTTFNSMFFILTIGYIIYLIHEKANSLNLNVLDVLVDDLFINNRLLTSMIVFQFYSFLIGTIYTAADWILGEAIDKKAVNKKKDAAFLMNRVKNRGNK